MGLSERLARVGRFLGDPEWGNYFRWERTRNGWRSIFAPLRILARAAFRPAERMKEKPEPRSGETPGVPPLPRRHLFEPGDVAVLAGIARERFPADVRSVLETAGG